MSVLNQTLATLRGHGMKSLILAATLIFSVGLFAQGRVEHDIHIRDKVTFNYNPEYAFFISGNPSMQDILSDKLAQLSDSTLEKMREVLSNKQHEDFSVLMSAFSNYEIGNADKAITLINEASNNMNYAGNLD